MFLKFEEIEHYVNTVSAHPFFLLGRGQRSVSHLAIRRVGRCGQKKNENAWGEGLGRLKQFLSQIFAWGITVFLVKNDCKKYGFEGSVSNVDFGSTH